MQRKYLKFILSYMGFLFLQNSVLAQGIEDPAPAVTSEKIEYQQDTAEIVARRLAIYDLCKKQNKPDFKKMVTQSKGEKICFTLEYLCEEKGSSGNSKVYQTQERCIEHGEFEKAIGFDSDGKIGGGQVGDDQLGGSSSGSAGGGIIVDGNVDFCSVGMGCGPCAGKCQKFFYQGKKKNSCIKCLEKNGFYCLASLLSGNRSSCNQGSVRYSCSSCSGSGVGVGGISGGDVDLDCSTVSKKDCTKDHHKNKKDSDDCPGCKKYPPGTGFFNVVSGLGNLFQGIGVGVGASGLMGHLNVKQCKDWYIDYNNKRVENSNSIVDWDCQKFAGAGGLGLGGIGLGGIGGGFGNGGFGFNPNFPGNFGGPWGNMNPYGNMGGLLNSGIQFNGNIGGNFGSQFSPWFNQGANGLPWGGGQFGGGWGGGQFGGGWGGGQFNGGGWGGGQFNGGGWGGGPQSNNTYWEGRMIQEQARRETGMRYFAPQPINPGWQFGYPRY